MKRSAGKGRITCRDGVAALRDYVDGRLAPVRRAALETHVSGCARCTAFVHGYRETPRIVRAATEAVLTTAAASTLRRFLVERI